MLKTIWMLFLPMAIFSQSDFEKEYEKIYAENIKKEYINDIYIPKDFNDAFEELKRLSEPIALEKFKKGDESEISRKLHFGLGRWMAVNWNFETGSRISHKMKEMGVTFPDDMCQMMIISFHRHLNGKNLLLEEQAKSYFEKRKAENEAKLKQSSFILSKNN
jgi:hypothetical protein